MKRTVRNLQHFLPLIGILGAGLLSFFLFSYDQKFQLAAMIATAAGYITWGIIHHKLKEDLSIDVILEYIFVAILGVVIVWSVLLRT